MTLLEKHEVCLDDLIWELEIGNEPVWQLRLEHKIADMRNAIAKLKGDKL